MHQHLILNFYWLKKVFKIYQNKKIGYNKKHENHCNISRVSCYQFHFIQSEFFLFTEILFYFIYYAYHLHSLFLISERFLFIYLIGMHAFMCRGNMCNAD